MGEYALNLKPNIQEDANALEVFGSSKASQQVSTASRQERGNSQKSGGSGESV